MFKEHPKLNCVFKLVTISCTEKNDDVKYTKNTIERVIIE